MVVIVGESIQAIWISLLIREAWRVRKRDRLEKKSKTDCVLKWVCPWCLGHLSWAPSHSEPEAWEPLPLTYISTSYSELAWERVKGGLEHSPSSTGLDCSSCSFTLFTSWPFPQTAATYDITSLLASGCSERDRQGSFIKNHSTSRHGWTEAHPKIPLTPALTSLSLHTPKSPLHHPPEALQGWGLGPSLEKKTWLTRSRTTTTHHLVNLHGVHYNIDYYSNNHH